MWKHRPAAWVALDDWPLFLEKEAGLDGHFVQTRAKHGLDRECIENALALFRFQVRTVPALPLSTAHASALL